MRPIQLYSTKKKKFTIGNKVIREGDDVFIIAEAGVNHNGRLDFALKLVDVAAEIGADAVKFQTFKAEEVVSNRGQMAEYQIKNIGKTESQLEMLKKLALPEEFYPPIIKRCKQKGVIFFSTPHGGKPSVDLLESLNVQLYKIDSGNLTNYLLLDQIAQTQKPMIVSTGMATLAEVKKTVNFIKSRGNYQIAILHCTTNYPCLPNEVDLAAMVTLMKKLDVPVGYSDHTEETQVAIMSATLGAAVYEFHITLDKTLPGPDQIASASPQEAKARVDAIRKVKIIMGNANKCPRTSEQQYIDIVRRSLVYARDLKRGKKINYGDIVAKRPGDGISPSQYEKFLGKKLRTNVKQNQQLSRFDFKAK